MTSLHDIRATIQRINDNSDETGVGISLEMWGTQMTLNLANHDSGSLGAETFTCEYALADRLTSLENGHGTVVSQSDALFDLLLSSVGN